MQLLAGQIALWRLRRSAKPVPAHVRRLFEMFSPPGRKAPVLLASDRVAFPVCFGLFRPTVLLPHALARGADGDVLRWVLAHELDHLRRGDPWTGFWLAVARSCYFFLPWYWAIRKELRLVQEYLADAAAAAAGGNPTDYAAFLVSLTGQPASRRLSRHPLGAQGVRAKPSDLFRRVNMLLQSGGRAPRTPSKFWSRLTAGGTLGAAVLLSGIGLADEKKTEKSVTAVVASPEGKAGETTIELVVAGEDDPKVEKRVIRRGDGEEPKVLQVQGRVEVNTKRIEEIKAKIAEAAKKGDVEAVRKLADALAKAAGETGGRVVVAETVPMRVEAGRQEKRVESPKAPVTPKAPTAPKVAAVPATPVTPRTPALAGVMAAQVSQEKLKEAQEKGEAKFKEALEKLQDNPEAREVMEKAMREFHKAMEEKMKAAPKGPAGAFVQPGQFQFQGLIPAQGLHGLQVQPLQGLNWTQIPEGKTFTWQGSAKSGEGRLGIAVEKPQEVLVEQLNLPKGQGVIIVQVVKDSPAEKAGIKAKDVLLTLSGKPVPSEPGDVIKLIGGLKNDEKIDVVVLRKGQKETIKGISVPEGKKIELRKIEGKGGVDFVLPKNAQLSDEMRKEIEKKIHAAHEEAHKAGERVQRDAQKFQEEARREVERAMKDLPKVQQDLQKEIARLKDELKRVEERAEKGGTKGGTSGGKGDAQKAKSSQSSMSVSTDGETFTISASKDGVKYEIAGTLDDGKAVAGKVSVKDGEKSYSGTLDKIPAQYRESVKSFLTHVSGSKR